MADALNIRKALLDLPALGSTDGTGTVRNEKAVKVFLPGTEAFWVLWEADDQTAFGYADLGFGMGELGYVNINELVNLRGRFGQRCEVDQGVTTVQQGYESRGVLIPDYV